MGAPRPSILLLTSRFDFACDYVVAQLRRRRVPYLRLNSEDLQDMELCLDPIPGVLGIRLAGQDFEIDRQTLRSVLYRRPSFLRDYGDDRLSPMDRFMRIQWASFLRNLMLFDEALWVNSPADIYRAEHKALQLTEASRIGFVVPETRITNAPRPDMFAPMARVAMKGLDTVLLRSSGREMFGFTTFEEATHLEPQTWKTAPGTLQSEIQPKLDVRVTVIGEHVFSAGITTQGAGIAGDWRMQKSVAEFTRHTLPKQIEALCVSLVRRLRLTFGAIDLALAGDEYYFLELNPTGEWAWLVDQAGLPIDRALADMLCSVVR